MSRTRSSTSRQPWSSRGHRTTCAGRSAYFAIFSRTIARSKEHPAVGRAVCNRRGADRRHRHRHRRRAARPRAVDPVFRRRRRNRIRFRCRRQHACCHHHHPTSRRGTLACRPRMSAAANAHICRVRRRPSANTSSTLVSARKASRPRPLRRPRPKRRSATLPRGASPAFRSTRGAKMPKRAQFSWLLPPPSPAPRRPQRPRPSDCRRPCCKHLQTPRPPRRQRRRRRQRLRHL